MKKTTPAHFIIAAIILFTTACNYGYEDCHETMYLENKSAAAIYYIPTLKEGFFNYDPSTPAYAADYKVTPGKTVKIRIGITLSCWEQVMKSAEGYVYIYIYDAAELETKGWDNTKGKPLKKYSLNTNQLKEMEWTVTYP